MTSRCCGGGTFAYCCAALHLWFMRSAFNCSTNRANPYICYISIQTQLIAMLYALPLYLLIRERTHINDPIRYRGRVVLVAHIRSNAGRKHVLACCAVLLYILLTL